MKIGNKKFISLISAIILLCALTASSLFSETDKQLPPLTIYETRGPTTKPQISLDNGTTLPKVPNQMMVYKAKSPNVTAKKVSKLADTMGLKGNLIEKDNKFIIKNSSNELEVLKNSGRIFYGDPSRTYGNISDPPLTLPKKEKAIELAEKFLVDKKLQAEDVEFDRVVIDDAEIATKDPNTGEISKKQIDLIMQVMFKREINNTPVVGPGSKLKVYIDDGGVAGVYKCWRDYEEFREHTILTPLHAFEKLREKGIHTIAGEMVTVKEIYLAYYAQPAVDKQEYLQPIYVFEVDNGRGDTIKEYIPAIPQ